MDITRYKTVSYTNSIHEVVFEKETEKSYFSNGQRYAKESRYTNYHKTWQDAMDYLIQRSERVISCFEARLLAEQNELAKLKKVE